MRNLVALAVVLPLFLFLGLGAHGQQTKLKFEVANAKLPSARFDTAAVYDGDDSVYIVGGKTGGQRFAQVLEYSLGTDSLEVFTTGTEISGGEVIMSANGEYVVYLGGYNDAQNSMDSVFLFSTMSKEWKTAPQQLPENTFFHTVAWDRAGGVAYILGGFDGGSLDTIVRFDATNFSSRKVANLPSPSYKHAAVWADGKAYTFGGSSPNGICQFDPTTGQATRLSAQLPYSLQLGTAVHDEVNKLVYILSDSNLMTFNAANEEVKVIEMEPWPQTRSLHMAAGVYVKKLHRMYVFGGYGNSTTEFFDEIRYINLPGAPSSHLPTVPAVPPSQPPTLSMDSNPVSGYAHQGGVDVSTTMTIHI